MRRVTAAASVCLLGLLILLSPSTSSAQGTSADASRVDALIEAGIERYRAGAYREAIGILNSMVATRADSQPAQLYLALSHLQLGDNAQAERHLVALRALPINPRLRAQVDYVLEGMRAGPVSPSLRRFIALALDETMSFERSPQRPPFAENLLRRNFPYFP
jgi:tetratricopeptide (TPR) repeat protein